MRDFIYVKDAVAVTLHFLEHRDVSGIFNCGSGRARTWKDLVKAVFAAMSAPPEIEFIEMPEILCGKYQYFTEAPINKLRELATPARRLTSIEDAVADYVGAIYLKSRANRRADGVARACK